MKNLARGLFLALTLVCACPLSGAEPLRGPSSSADQPFKRAEHLATLSLRRDQLLQKAEGDARAYFAWRARTQDEFHRALNAASHGFYQALGPVSVNFAGAQAPLSAVAMTQRQGSAALVWLSQEGDRRLGLSPEDFAQNPEQVRLAETRALRSIEASLRSAFPGAIAHATILEPSSATRRRTRLSVIFNHFPAAPIDPFKGLVSHERWILPEGQALWSALMSSAGDAQAAQLAIERLSNLAPSKNFIYGEFNFNPMDASSAGRHGPLGLLKEFRGLEKTSRELNEDYDKS